jgi:hypothetical protein
MYGHKREDGNRFSWWRNVAVHLIFYVVSKILILFIFSTYGTYVMIVIDETTPNSLLLKKR